MPVPKVSCAWNTVSPSAYTAYGSRRRQPVDGALRVAIAQARNDGGAVARLAVSAHDTPPMAQGRVRRRPLPSRETPVTACTWPLPVRRSCWMKPWIGGPCCWRARPWRALPPRRSCRSWMRPSSVRAQFDARYCGGGGQGWRGGAGARLGRARAGQAETVQADTVCHCVQHQGVHRHFC